MTSQCPGPRQAQLAGQQVDPAPYILLELGLRLLFTIVLVVRNKHIQSPSQDEGPQCGGNHRFHQGEPGMA